MIIFKTTEKLSNYIDIQKQAGKTIGFVPTMGALHPGHISLIHSSIAHNDITVASIFVNPTQFNNVQDFEKYPKTLDRDIDMLEASGCDLLFFPSREEIYVPGKELVQYDLGFLDTVLEAAYRPGHFQGVGQVVMRLLEIVQPDDLFIGQKDFQQCMVITRLIKDAGLPVTVHIHPTLREIDGLAMSSRNMRLGKVERAKAPLIYKALQKIAGEIKPGPLKEITGNAAGSLAEQGFKVDYLELADAGTLQPVDTWDGKIPVVVLAAAYLGEVRLIDNLLISAAFPDSINSQL